MQRIEKKHDFFQVKVECQNLQIMTMVVYRVQIHFCDAFEYGGPYQMACAS